MNIRKFLLLLPFVLLMHREIKGESSYYDCGGCANVCSYNSCSDCWHGIVGAGYAFSLDIGLDPDLSFWDFANEGYDDDIGSSPFFFIGLGSRFCGCLDFNLTYSFYDTFHYQRYQTGVSATPGFTGSARTRFFDLDHQNVMVDLLFDPSCYDWCFSFCNMQIAPLIGAGIGAGVNKVNNFHTVAFNTDTETATVTSIGDPVTETSFAWRVIAALRINCLCSGLSFDLGYRYYDGGCFRGPSSIVINTPDLEGAFLSGPAWEGDFKVNEVFFNINYCF